MRRLARWFGRGLLAVALLVVLLLVPVAYTELACRGEPLADNYVPLITDPEWRRDESRTLTTYPEWHIVYAYDDYAEVIRTGDPHDFGFFRAIAGFWTSLCPLAERSAAMGGFTGDSKLTIYTIGVSFTVEMTMKALYEETLGRAATWVRGAEHAPLDDLSATQARDYAGFLQQTPWYKWNFRADRDALDAAATDAFRDRERNLALGLEYGVKAAYAEVIADAVKEIGEDQLRMRSIVSGLSAAELDGIEGVAVVGERPEGIEIETDRYRAFTRILEHLAAAGADIAEVAGNDEILFSAISDAPRPGALYSFPRQGYGDWRNLFVVPVRDLAARLRSLDGMKLEHVHDY